MPLAKICVMTKLHFPNYDIAYVDEPIHHGIGSSQPISVLE